MRDYSVALILWSLMRQPLIVILGVKIGVKTRMLPPGVGRGYQETGLATTSSGLHAHLRHSWMRRPIRSAGQLKQWVLFAMVLEKRREKLARAFDK
jgi:hypothetical protein